MYRQLLATTALAGLLLAPGAQAAPPLGAGVPSLVHHAPRRAHALHVPAVLQAIAECESHDNPRAIGGGGAFRGKYQFDYGTWASVGGHGDPAAAPEREQDMRAVMLYEREGTAPWPVCG